MCRCTNSRCTGVLNCGTCTSTSATAIQADLQCSRENRCTPHVKACACCIHLSPSPCRSGSLHSAPPKSWPRHGSRSEPRGCDPGARVANGWFFALGPPSSLCCLRLNFLIKGYSTNHVSMALDHVSNERSSWKTGPQ